MHNLINEREFSNFTIGWKKIIWDDEMENFQRFQFQQTQQQQDEHNGNNDNNK